MPQMVEIQRADDPRDVIHQAVQALAEGRLVVLPTETVYVVAAHALQPEAVAQLPLPAEPACDARVLALKSGDEALDYIPNMGRLGAKLTRRCWPGPVILQFPQPAPRGLLDSLPPRTQHELTRGGHLSFRVPAHEILQEILRFLPAPLVLSAEERHPAPPAVRARDLGALPASVAFVIDDGPTKYGGLSSTVRIADTSWSVTREGVVSQRTLTRLASEMFLFVCTGNTCRSPMAEALFRRLLAQRLRVSDDDLVDRGYVVASSGLAAVPGSPPSPEAVEILHQREIDLSPHVSQPLTPRLLHQADYIITMTRHHREAILEEYPELASRVQLLSRSGTDVSDPIGGTLEDYARCAKEIESHLRALLADLPPPPRGPG